MLKSNHKQLHDICFPQLKKELLKVLYAPDFKFNAGDKLAKVKYISNITRYMAAFYTIYYECVDLSKADAMWRYIQGLKI